MVLFGIGRNAAYRMSSLLPAPMGTGRRNNSAKREYVRLHLADIEYRTMACRGRADAVKVERGLKDQGDYLFMT